MQYLLADAEKMGHRSKLKSTYTRTRSHTVLKPNTHRRRDSTVELNRVGEVYTIRN